MNEIDFIRQTALESPDNQLECYAYADHLEGEGQDDLAFAWRWMGHHGRRPAQRSQHSNKIRFAVAWYRLHPFHSKLDREIIEAQPHSILSHVLFVAMDIGHPLRTNLFVHDVDEAIELLAIGLARLRMEVELD